MEQRRNAPLLAIVVATSLLLGGLAAFSTVSAWLTLTHEQTMEEVRLGHPVAPAALAAAAIANERAAGWFEAARHRTDAAALHIALGQAGRPGELPKAEALVRAALAAAPAQPYDWARLAYLRLARGDAAGAVSAWKMSVLTGRYVPNLMAARLILGIRLLGVRDAELGGQVADQMLVLGQTIPDQLALIARGLGAEPMVRATLTADPAALAAFNKSTVALVGLAPERARLAAHGLAR